MQKKIYINNNELYITTELGSLNETAQKENTVIVEELEDKKIEELLSELENGNKATGVIVNKNIQEAEETLLKKLKLIKAGGGLIYNEEKEILLIFRRGKWDLPKGKLDEGEDIETCAIREVEEETGLTDVELEKPLVITYHTYIEKGERILKESHWYLMKANAKQVLVPQTDEDIDKCEWVKIKNLPSYLENTHLSIIDVVKKGIEALKETKNA